MAGQAATASIPMRSATRRVALDIAIGGACAAAALAFTWFVWATNHRAFFSDDAEHAFAPMFLAIGRSLAHGHWPTLTLQVLNGGALIGEYQYGLFNPFTLLACLAISPLRDQAISEAVFVAFHYAVLAPGAYALARNCGAARPLATLSALTFLTNNFICYWLAGSWAAGFEGMAWLTWALAFLMRAQASRAAFVATALFTYMVVTAGSYHIVVMLGVAAVGVGLVRWRMQGARQGAAPLAAVFLGGLLAMPAILPVLAMGAVGIRNGGLANDGRLAMDLYAVLAPSSPFHLSHFLGFARFGRIGTPFYFAGWFLLPLLPLIDWRRLGRPSTTIVALAVLAVVFIIATQGPEQVFSIRYPIWYLAALHLVLLTLFVSVASRTGFAPPTRARIWGVVLIAYFGWLASVQSDPAMRSPALAAAVLILVLAGVGALAQARSRPGYVIAGIAGTVIFACATHLVFPTNGDQLDRGAPTAAPVVSDLSAIPTTASVFLGGIDEAPIWKAPEIQTALMPLAHGGSNPFGYSPVGHRAFSYAFLVQLWGTVVPAGIPALFAPTAMGGEPYVDLMRIDRLVVPKVDDRVAKVAALAGPDWRATRNRSYTVTFERVAPRPSQPGSLAWATPGVAVRAVGSPSAEHERFDVTSRVGGGDRLVLDRIAWPGYRVSFNGRPLAISLTGAPLMTIELPGGTQTGRLAIDYAPPLIGLGLAGAGLAVLGLIGVWIGWPRLATTAGPRATAALA